MTFDYWNTLCCEPPGGYLRGRRLEAMSQVLVDAGVGSAGVVLPILTLGYDAGGYEGFIFGGTEVLEVELSTRHLVRRVWIDQIND